MNTPERIAYITKHRRKGDVKSIADHLSLNISNVYDIVTGKYFGENGERVLQTLENKIEQRLKEERKISRFYQKKLGQKL